MALVILAINDAFVRWWVGADQWGGHALSTMMVIVMLLRHLSVSYVYTLFALSDVKWMTLIALAEGGITLALMLVLVRTMGPIGAPTASLAALLGTTFPAAIWRMSVELRVRPVQVVTPLLPWAVRFVPCAVGAVVLGRVLRPEGIIGLGTLAAAVGTVYALLLMPVALRSSLGPYLRTHLPRRALAPFEPRANAA
jgi:O-antigen/teichoic acid export membrane protein